LRIYNYDFKKSERSQEKIIKPFVSLSFLVRLFKNHTMLSKQRIPDLIVIAVLGLFLILLNYTDNISVISNFPFIFLLIMYFVGRGVTWYIINNHMDNGDEEGGQ